MINKPIIKSIVMSDASAGIQITGDGLIYYTLDGTEPTKESILYTDIINYPVNALIKAICINEDFTEQSDVEEYQCNEPWYRHINGGMSKIIMCCIKSYIDALNNTIGSLTNSELLDITYGKIIHLGYTIDIPNGHILPYGFDFDDKFPDAATYIFNDLAKKVKRGQILQRNGWLKISDGNNWHDFQQIYSGTYSTKPTIENHIPVGFAYFCTDKKSPESSEPGLIIYHKGNDIWVDSLGRIVDDNYPLLTKGTTSQRPTLTSNDSGFEYYDSTLKKKILWNGTEWTNLDGTVLA